MLFLAQRHFNALSPTAPSSLQLKHLQITPTTLLPRMRSSVSLATPRESSKHETGSMRSRQMDLSAKVQQLGRAGNWKRVLALLSRVDFIPDSFVWRAAIEAMGKQWREAVELVHRMQRLGMQPTVFHYCAAISVCVRAKQLPALAAAEQLFADMQSKGVAPSLYVYSAMIRAYGNASQWQKAEYLFLEL